MSLGVSRQRSRSARLATLGTDAAAGGACPRVPEEPVVYEAVCLPARRPRCQRRSHDTMTCPRSAQIAELAPLAAAC